MSVSVRVLQGSVFDVLPTLAPGIIDCAVTSPPYWMLRSYLPKGHALKPLELGSEPTPDCGRPLVELRDDLTEKERAFVIGRLKALGLL